MRADILASLYGLAQIYEKHVTEDLINIWDSALGELSKEEMARAVKLYVLDPKSLFFPKPGQIFGLARPQINVEEEAAMIADLIFDAQRSHGTDKEGYERARSKIGEFGWNYILQRGGWHQFVLSIKRDDDVPILKSQVRKALMGLLQKQRNDTTLKIETGGDIIKLSDLGIEMKGLK